MAKKKPKKQSQTQKSAKQAKYDAKQEKPIETFQATQEELPVSLVQAKNKLSVQGINVQNASQQRAAYALKAIKNMLLEFKSAPDKQTEFKSYVNALPAMVQMNGLGQAIAFYRSRFTETNKSKKGAAAYAKLYDILSDWLCGDKPFAIYPTGDLLENIVCHELQKYRLAQSELQNLLVWLKKMTMALIEVPEKEEK